jgi:putative transposase
MATALEAIGELGVAPVCQALGLPRATWYRRARPKHGPMRRGRQPRALSAEQRAEVLAVLHEPRFQDAAPAEVYAQLLDEGRSLCSERTLYRVLAENQEVRERRNQLRHPNHPVPQLHATKPNELWSWDITKLHGPAKWTYFYLYVVLDVFSRYDSRRPRLLHDLQAGGPADGGPGRDEDALQASRLQRQPLQRGALQDDEVPA